MSTFPHNENDDLLPLDFSGKSSGLSPRDYLVSRGARMVSDDDLIAALLDIAFPAGEKAQTWDAAEDLLQTANGSFYQLSRWEYRDFEEKGFTPTRVANLLAALEVGRRFEERTEQSEPISEAREIFKMFEQTCIRLDREKCWILCLDAKNRIIRREEVSAGTAGSSAYHPRDFLRPAIRANASAIVLVHNHPSGDATPSKNDVKVTRLLAEACKIIGITLLDHVIVGRRNIGPNVRGFFAFSESGML